MKRTVVLLLTLLVSLVALSSCNPNKPKDESTDPNADLSNMVYGSGIETALITNMDLDDEDVEVVIDSLSDKIYSYTKNWVIGYAYSDERSQSTHEIVVGDTSRPITTKAKELLADEIERAALSSNDYSSEKAAFEDIVGYAVYSEGGSVSIVWSDFHIFEVAVNYFLDNYVIDSSLTLDDGFLDIETLSLSDLLEERGNRIREEQWAALEEAIGEEYGSEIVASMRKLYNIYQPKAVSWLANLYDADIGGFYYSNSARNTVGYLPDIESTYGALAFVEETGMAEMFDNDYSKALPSWMLEQIGAWVQSLQDEDGYFYHPQWPKEYIYARGLQSRITRDKGSAVSILSKLGIPTVYPVSAVLDGKLSDGNNTVVAVSKLVQTAGVLSQFSSVESFTNYINDLDKEVLAIKDPDERAHRLYAIGNEFQSTVSLVKQNSEYVTILHEFFKKHQDPKTGTWSSVMTYNATNSLHKIGYVYNSLGLKYDYMYEMIDTIINILSRDVETDPIGTGVDCGNAWACIEHIYRNIRGCSATEEEAEEKLREVRNYVYSNITTAIDATYSQIVGFLQPDGSFGYSRYGSSYTSQGCPAAVYGSAEGDVNGHGCISYTITGYIAAALDLPEYEVMMYSEAERVKFVNILEDLGTIIKDEVEFSDDIALDFEDGKIPEQINVAVNEGNLPADGASVVIEKIDGSNVLHITAVSRKGVAGRQNHAVKLPIALTASQVNAAVIEFDICVYSTGSSEHQRMIEVPMYGDDSLVVYPTIGKNSAGKVILYDSDGAVITELGNVDEKIRVRFEYFWDEGEYKVYVNDKFKAKGTTLCSPDLTHVPITKMSFYTPTSLYANYYIDNLRCSRIQKVYDPDETVQYPKEPVTEDFEGVVNSEQYGAGYNVTTEKGFSALYSNKYTNNGGATALVRTDETNGNKFLSIYAPARANGERSHAVKLSIPTQMCEKPNAFVFETSIKLNSISTSKNFLQILFINSIGDYRYGQLNMSVDDRGEVCLAELPIGYFDQWFDLRIEYHFDKGVIRVYNNDLYMGEITKFSDSDATTANDVSKLDSLNDFTLGTLNSGGSVSFSIDDIAIYTTELEYTEKEVDTLPEPNPDKDDFIPEPLPDEEPEPEPEQPGTGGGLAPDVEFPGMEPPMSIPDDVTPVDPDLRGDEDMGDWT